MNNQIQDIYQRFNPLTVEETQELDKLDKLKISHYNCYQNLINLCQQIYDDKNQKNIILTDNFDINIIQSAIDLNVINLDSNNQIIFSSEIILQELIITYIVEEVLLSG